MSDSEAWKEYCKASLALSNQEDVGEEEAKARAEELGYVFTKEEDPYRVFA
jgi:hypothetical protein